MMLYSNERYVIYSSELYVNVLMLLQLMSERLIKCVRLLYEKLLRGIEFCILNSREVILNKVLLSNARRFVK
jgi:hypothetical protein